MPKLKNIASIKAGGKPIEIKEGDIVMLLAGNNVGEIVPDEQRSDKICKNHYALIRSEDTTLKSTLQSKQEVIKALAKGSAVPKVFIKDLETLEV